MLGYPVVILRLVLLGLPNVRFYLLPFFPILNPLFIIRVISVMFLSLRQKIFETDLQAANPTICCAEDIKRH